MTHCDPETLALAALGEPIPSPDAEHLSFCHQCQQEVADLTALVSLARDAPRELTPAPDGVWDAIQAELGLGGASDTTSRVAPPKWQGAATAASADEGRAISLAAGEPTVDPRIAESDAVTASRRPAGNGQREDAGQVVRLGSRRRLLGVAALAASVGAIVGGSVVWATIDRTAEQTRQSTVIAQAVLEPLSPRVTEPGEAQVLETADGLAVRVDARSLPAGTGFHEVWLLDADATKLVALGALPSGSIGTFTVPPGVEVTDFPVVDISLEPYDGNPEHSHDSLLRGVLQT